MHVAACRWVGARHRPVGTGPGSSAMRPGPRSLTCWLVAALSLGFAATTASAYPPPGPTYELLAHGVRTSIRIDVAQTRLVAYRIGWHVGCTRGKALRLSLLNAGEKPTLVAAGGTFKHETPKERWHARYRGHWERASVQSGFAGQIAADRQSITGTSHVAVRSRHRFCHA